MIKIDNIKISIAIYIMIISLITVGSVTAELPSMPLTYDLSIKYEKGDLNIESMTLQHAYVPDASMVSISSQGRNIEYYMKLFDIYGQEIYNNTFSFSIATSSSAVGCINDKGVYDLSLCDGPSYAESSSAIENVAVPYSNIGDLIQIYSKDGELKLSLNVSEYADYCGDGKCSESYWSCPSDCQASPEDEAALERYETQYESKSISGGETNISDDTKEKSRIMQSWMYYLIGAIIIILAIVILVAIGKKKSQNDKNIFNQRPQKPY